MLRIRDFRRLLLSRFFITLGLQLQSVVIGWQIFRMTADPLALGLVGLAEALPYMACLLWAGHQTDRQEKRTLILFAEGGLVSCAGIFAMLTWVGLESPWPLYVVIGLTGLCRSLLWPSSAAYVEITVPKAIYSRAASWNSTLWQVGAIVGPLVGGWMYAAFDAVRAYLGAAVFLAIGLWHAARLRPLPPSPTQRDESGWESLLGGIRFVFSKQTILAALTLDMFAVLFGGAVALLPIFAERFQVGPVGLGVLRAALPGGALLMALYQAYAPPFRETGRAMLMGIACFGVCMALFAISPWFWLSGLWLGLAGAADNISVVVRASILQAMTPDHLRGRVSSVNGFFISSSNEIVAFESGVAAKLLGVIPSVVVGGVLTVITVLVTAWRAPALRRLQLRPDGHAPTTV